MNIAILIRKETADRCIGKGCLNAFYNRKDAFKSYGPEVQLIGFTHTGGDLDHKIARLIENGVQTVHLSSCLRAKDAEYEVLAQRLAQHFTVVGYTHGSAEGKSRKTFSILKSIVPVKPGGID